MFSSSGIKSTKRKLGVSLKKQNLKKQKPNYRNIGLLVDDDIATVVKKDKGKHQQILNDGERFMSHNIVRLMPCIFLGSKGEFSYITSSIIL